ncbi:hypothetical protein HW452_06975 [Halomonas aquamarina]|uniref:Uncharacterized protein n=1 Tax=Vreelandella aquamarina TaxID=77097 RepID=A0ACC5VSN9_9GAMM|nr:hypothetical protein [Halomonas aquamarina]MBZ5487265.1 hypothetical protein [Halomonas aquamarina]
MPERGGSLQAMRHEKDAQYRDDQIQHDQKADQQYRRADIIHHECHRQRDAEHEKEDAQQHQQPFEEHHAQVNRAGVVLFQGGQRAGVVAQAGLLVSGKRLAERDFWVMMASRHRLPSQPFLVRRFIEPWVEAPAQRSDHFTYKQGDQQKPHHITHHGQQAQKEVDADQKVHRDRLHWPTKWPGRFASTSP